jgi:ATP-binding cassette subfamily B protein
MANNSISRSIDIDKIWHIATVLIIFYSIIAFCSFSSGLIMNRVTQSYGKKLREEISEKINRIPLRYFDAHPYGDTLSIVTNDVDTITQSLQQSVTTLLQSITTLIGVLIAMFITNWIMAFTVFATLPLMLLNIGFITKLAIPQFMRRQKATGVVNGVVEENFSGTTVIKLFNAEERRQNQFELENEKLHKAMIKAQIFGGFMQPIMSFISYFAYAAVFIVGGLLMANGNIITYGTITAFMIYVNLFQSPLSQIAQSMNTIQMATAASSRVFGILDEEEEIDDSKYERKLISNDFNKVLGHVEFKNVKFGYVEDKIIIPDFSCDVKPGMKVAIVGPTGAGKTTLVNLLMRFYEINDGDILIDGVSINDMSKAELRSIFGMVLQDSWIFDGTIKENICYSNENVSDENLNKALEDACLSNYVNTLHDGINTKLNGEGSLSQGQKQLITIDRALVDDAPLLILDEATSNVDTRTEILIQQAMDNLTKGRTSFVIAHRLSTIKNADLILVLKDGNIVEQGNHEYLMNLGGFYSNLYNSQFVEGEEI